MDDRAIRFEGDWTKTELDILRQRKAFERACQNNGHHAHAEVKTNGKEETGSQAAEEIRQQPRARRARPDIQEVI